MSRYRVIASHTRTYADALSVMRGERVTVHKRDTEWPGWVWCENTTGTGGWLPERIISQVDALNDVATIEEDFDTTELTTTRGEALEGATRESGWIWLTNAAGHSGWVPEQTVVVEG